MVIIFELGSLVHTFPSFGIPSPLASIYAFAKRLKLVVPFNTPGS